MIIFIPSVYFATFLTLRTGNVKQHSRINSILKEDISVYKESFDGKDEGANKHSSFPIFSNLCLILKQKIFMFCVLALASLSYVITAVQYWGPDYMEKVLLVEDKKLRLLAFGIVCISSPTLGIILGGYTSHLIGGYESKHSIMLCLIFACLAGACSIPVPWVNTLTLFTLTLWVMLFFGGAIMPLLTGIIISSLPKSLRGSANSITNFFINLFGYLPSPFVYGFINTYFSHINDRIAFTVSMYYSFTGVILLIFATYFRYRDFEKLSPFKKRLDAKDTRGSIISESIGNLYGKYMKVDQALIEDTEKDEEVLDEDRKTNILNTPTSQTRDNFLKGIDTESDKNYAVTIETPYFPRVDLVDESEFWNKKKKMEIEPNSNKEDSLFGNNGLRSHHGSGQSNKTINSKNRILNKLNPRDSEVANSI